VLKPILGASMLERMLERVRAARELDDVVVATTKEPSDDPIREICAKADVRCVSGHPTDLLDRHMQAARACDADVVAKIPSDCPLVDPRIIDHVAGYFRKNGHAFDFVSNLHPATYPDGHDVEIIPRPVLETAWRDARKPFEREHTTPFVWDQPDCFRVGNVTWPSGRDLSMTHRMTVDYPEDYEFVRSVFDELYDPDAEPFSLEDVLELLDVRPDIFRINAHLAGVNWYRNHLGELRTIGRRNTVAFEDA
jgi:spore coat polysaccharide biosynthesis protein SpsF